MDVVKFKTLLLQQKEKLLNSSKDSSNNRKPVELDQQSIGRLSRMDAIQQQGVAITTETQRQNELKKLIVHYRELKMMNMAYA